MEKMNKNNHEHCDCHEHLHNHEEYDCCHEHKECNCGHEHIENKDTYNHDECDCYHDHHGCNCEHAYEESNHDKCECHHEHHECEEEHKHGECGCHHEEHEHKKNEIKKVNFKFKVHHLDCANCAMKIEKAIKEEPFIRDASLSFSTSTLFVDAKMKDTDELLKRLNKIADQIEPGAMFTLYEKEIDSLHHTKELMQIVLATVVLFVVICFEGQLPFNTVYGYLLAYLLAGYHVLGTALKNIRKGDVFDENFLMGIATIGALYIGSFEEAVAVMLFYDLGELLQAIAVARSRKSISDLMDIKVEKAIVVKDGKEIEIDVDEVKEGDILIVKAGERIPVDGVVVEGNTTLDTSALSGESLPKDIEVEDEVLSGCLNVSHVFKMKAVRPVSESTVAKVLDMVENAAAKKAPIEKFITRFSRVYTPSVVFAALLLVLIPTVLGGSFNEWLYKGCTFLVVSCPCALVISIPLGLFAGIGAAGKKGVLIKGGNYLEMLSEMDTLVFDKTGTITKGTFNVDKVVGNDGLLELAAYGEFYSNHPIAKSIVAKYGEELNQACLQQYEEKAGYGVSVLYDGKVLLVGNEKLMDSYSISYDKVAEIGTMVHVAYDGCYQGYLVILDELKETSKQAIQLLKKLGVKKTVMLSGDQESIAQLVAKQCGIDEVHAKLLPQDKVCVLETYMNEKHKVGFVGDGINDAPVLMRSDIGIAMGGIGSDAAIEASDVVLMNDDLMSIVYALKTAKDTKKILWQNIIFSLFVKGIVLVLTTVGFANMWMGVFADVGVTLIAILNAMRILWLHK